jgi:hypothetical protein
MPQYYIDLEAIAISFLLKPAVCNVRAGLGSFFDGKTGKYPAKPVFRSGAFLR